MRVTSQMFPRRLEFDLQRIKLTMDQSQNQITTGQRVRYASDDSAAYRRSLGIQGGQIRTQQLRQNIKLIKTRIEQDIATAKSVNDVVSRASELANRAINGVHNATDLDTMAVQVNNMIEQVASLANKQFNGQYLYGGTNLLVGGGTDPYTFTRNAQNQITAVTYNGNEVSYQVEIEEGANMDYNTIGSSTTGIPQGLFVNNGVDIFQSLIDLRDNLAAGNASAVLNTNVAQVVAVEDNTSKVLGRLSANLERVNSADNLHQIQLQADEETLSSLSDTDLPSAIFQLTQSQTAFQAALQTGSKVLDLSLINYLR